MHIARKFTTSDLEHKITEIVKGRRRADHNKITPTATFEEIGFDSVDEVCIVIYMEEKLGIRLPDEEAVKINSIRDAVTIFSKYSKS